MSSSLGDQEIGAVKITKDKNGVGLITLRNAKGFSAQVNIVLLFLFTRHTIIRWTKSKM